MEITETILQDINHLKTRAGMHFIDDKSYYAMKTFITGYISGLCFSANKNFFSHLNRWQNAKYKKTGNIIWTELIPYMNKDKTDEELRLTLLSNLEEYFIKNPNWQNIVEE